MIVTAKCFVAGIIWIALVGSYCGAAPDNSIKRFIAQLECSISIEAADRIAVENGLPTSNATQQPLVGDRSINADNYEIGFKVRNEMLVDYRLIEYGPKTARSTPRKDLCTEMLSFDLVLNVPTSLIGSSVAVDGSTVGDIHERFGTIAVLTAGDHTVTILHPLFQPISRRFVLSPSSEGVPRVTISESEVRKR